MMGRLVDNPVPSGQLLAPWALAWLASLQAARGFAFEAGSLGGILSSLGIVGPSVILIFPAKSRDCEPRKCSSDVSLTPRPWV